MQISPIQQNNTSFKAKTVKVNALTKFVNTFSKAGRTANQQIKKISEPFCEMDVFQKKLSNGMIALQHISRGEKGLFRTKDSQIPYTPTRERLILISKDGDIIGEKRLNINTTFFRLLHTNFPILVTSITKNWKEKPYFGDYNTGFVNKTKVIEFANEFISTRVTKERFSRTDGSVGFSMIETLKTNKDYDGAILDEWLFRNVSYRWRNLARKEASDDRTDLYTYRPPVGPAPILWVH